DMSRIAVRGVGRVVGVLIVVATLLLAFAVIIPLGAGARSVQGGSFASADHPDLPSPAAACGQLPVPLASASSYAILASSTVTSTGNTAITGNLGLSPGTSVTGFPPATITGIKNITTPSAAAAMANLTIAYNNASGRTNCAVTIAGNIGGQTLTPGLYKSTSSLAISSGDLTLSGGGNPNGVFVFQVASAFTTTSGRAVVLSDGAQAGNVYWQIGSSVTIGTTSVMKGTIMAHDSISMLTGSVLNGRVMAQTGEVSLAATTIVVPTSSTSTPTYPVTFTESGLPVATSWSVTYGGVTSTSVTSTIVFNVESGTYPFSVNLAGFIGTPGSGTVTVNGAPAGQAISFAAGQAGTFSITFTETGLPSGTSWTVTSGGVAVNSLTTTVGFTVPSGTYAYSVQVVSNYTASPSTGSLMVNGAAGTQTIAFTALNGGGGGGGGSGPGGNGTMGLSSTEWAVIGIVVVAAVVAGVIGLALVMRRK
ncbi:MAG: DUF3494 domain-containing protein, partial [Thermoplasmata archaeon]|nr:DUF3494 domain-containing protein [Thermoplasmata archaeon]